MKITEFYRSCKHFFIASSISQPTTKSPVEDGKFSFLFDYFNTVFDKMSSQSFSLMDRICDLGEKTTFI